MQLYFHDVSNDDPNFLINPRRDMWGPYDPTISYILTLFYWYQNDFHIDKSFHFLMIYCRFY